MTSRRRNRTRTSQKLSQFLFGLVFLKQVLRWENCVVLGVGRIVYRSRTIGVEKYTSLVGKGVWALI